MEKVEIGVDVRDDESRCRRFNQTPVGGESCAKLETIS